MKTVFSLLILTLITLSNTLFAQSGKNPEDFLKYVNPFIGTGSIDSLSLSGSNFPGAALPFGFVQLSPDTDDNPEDPCSGYDFADDTIVGFSHTHLSGTGVADLFDVLFMPYRGEVVWNPFSSVKGAEGYSSGFDHKNESASPGYYSVLLDDAEMNVELTATEHCGVHRYSSTTEEPFHFMIDLNHSLDKSRPYWSCRILESQIRVVDSVTIEGYRMITGWADARSVFFRAEFSRPFKTYQMKSGSHVLNEQPIINGNALQLVATFDSENSPLVIRVGLSSVSYSGARENLQAEVCDFDFNAVKKKAEEAWTGELSKIEVEGSEDQKTLFYTSLYHTCFHPNNIADVSGDYIASNGEKKCAADSVHYSTFSLWDTYRAAHPLYTLTQKERTAGFINSMIRQYEDYGYLPIWQLWGKETYCMIGNHAIPVIVDAYFKGIQGFDYQLAYEAVKASSLVSHRNSYFELLEEYGYFPEDLNSQSVSITLEVAYNDWCVAQMAKAMGEEADYVFFTERSQAYLSLFDKKIGFFRGKNHNGEWIEPFSPLKYGGNGGYPFTEGNGWQYLWYVPQEVDSLANLMGGKELFADKLDQFFTLDAKPGDVNGNASGFIGQYAHGNEPSHHIAYLYNFTDEPWKAQKYCSIILNDLYSNSPSGYSGNEDCGQMSAWYVFSALGFYPVNPANGVYCFGSPQLEQAVIHLEGEKTFVVKTKNCGANNPYIQKITLNGKPYKKNYILHSTLVDGGVLEFEMGRKPNKKLAKYEKPIEFAESRK